MFFFEKKNQKTFKHALRAIVAYITNFARSALSKIFRFPFLKGNKKLFLYRDFFDSALMAAAFKLGAEKRFEDFNCFTFADKTRRERENVSVVMSACES